MSLGSPSMGCRLSFCAMKARRIRLRPACLHTTARKLTPKSSNTANTTNGLPPNFQPHRRTLRKESGKCSTEYAKTLKPAFVLKPKLVPSSAPAEDLAFSPVPTLIVVKINRGSYEKFEKSPKKVLTFFTRCATIRNS